MVTPVLGQVLNYAANQRRFDLQEEQMRQNQEYRQAQLGQQQNKIDQYDEFLAQGQQRLDLEEAERVQKERNGRILGNFSGLMPILRIGDDYTVEIKNDEATKAAIKEGKYDQFILQQLNTSNSPLKDSGGAFKELRKETINGETFFIPIGEYGSGEPGVLTEEGGSGPNEKVTRFSVDEVIDLLSERSQLNLSDLRNSSPLLYTQLTSTIMGSAAARDRTQDQMDQMKENQSVLSAEIQALVGQQQDVNLERAVIKNLSEAKGTEKKQFLLDIGRQLLNTDDPETMERLNLLEQSIKDDSVTKESPEEELARLERIAASGAFANEGFTGQEELMQNIAELKGVTVPSFSGYGYEIATEEQKGKPFTFGKDFALLKRKASALTADYAEQEKKVQDQRKILEQASTGKFSQSQLEAKRDRLSRAEEDLKDIRGEFSQLNEDYNTEVLDRIDSKIERIQIKVDNNVASPAEINEIEKLQEEKAKFIKEGAKTPSMKQEEFKGIEDKINKLLNLKDQVNPFADASPEFLADLTKTLDAAVDDGTLTFSAQQQKIAAQAFEEAGVKKFDDFRIKLPSDQQLIARAILSVTAPDQQTRTAVRELLEIEVTGGEMDASVLQKQNAATAQMAAEASMLNAQRSWRETFTTTKKEIDRDSLPAYDKVGAFADEVDPVLTAIGSDPNWVNAQTEGSPNMREVNRLLLKYTRILQDPNYQAKGEYRDPLRKLLQDKGRSLISASIASIIEPGFFNNKGVQLDDINLDNLFVDTFDNPTKLTYQVGSDRQRSIPIAELRQKIGQKVVIDSIVGQAQKNTKERVEATSG